MNDEDKVDILFSHFDSGFTNKELAAGDMCDRQYNELKDDLQVVTELVAMREQWIDLPSSRNASEGKSRFLEFGYWPSLVAIGLVVFTVISILSNINYIDRKAENQNYLEEINSFKEKLDRQLNDKKRMLYLHDNFDNSNQINSDFESSYYSHFKISHDEYHPFSSRENLAKLEAIEYESNFQRQLAIYYKLESSFINLTWDDTEKLPN